MKNKSILLAAMCSLLMLGACKKDNKTVNVPASNPPTVKPPVTPSPTIAQALAGKWYVVKDSIGVLDYDTPLPSMRNVSYSHADFVAFSADNSGSISSQAAYNALYTNYPSQFVDFIHPSVPNLAFNYQVTAVDNTLHIPMINSTGGIAYIITTLSANRLLLYTESIVVKIPHQYTFKQYIYLSK